MADGGAEKFVVIKMPTGWGRSIPNDFIAEYVGRYPGRAVGFAAVDPTEADAARELERAVTRLGLRGLKLSPVYHGFDPWSPPAWRLYEMADAVPDPGHVPHGRGLRSGRRASSGGARCSSTGSGGRSRDCA